MRICVLLLCFAASAAQAASALFVTDIFRAVVSPGVNGGCTLRIAVSPASQGLTCTDTRFVSLDCDGEFGSKSAGQSMFNAAQAAMFVSDVPPSLLVTDSQTFDSGSNSMCVVKRLDVNP